MSANDPEPEMEPKVLATIDHLVRDTHGFCGCQELVRGSPIESHLSQGKACGQVRPSSLERGFMKSPSESHSTSIFPLQT